MGWSKLDDRAPNHPKLIKAGGEAAWLWAAGLAYCNGHHTEGVIEKGCLKAVYAGYSEAKARRLAATLVAERLWHDMGSFYVVHDFADHNAVGEELELAKKKKTERQRRWRQKRLHVDDVDASTSVYSETSTETRLQASTETLLAGARARTHRRIPSHPIPTHTEEDYTTPVGVVASSRVRASSDDGEEFAEASRLLVVGYQRRYEAVARDAWMAVEANRQEIHRVAVWAVKQTGLTGESLGDVATAVLDGFFADEWASSHRWPWRRLAKDPAKYVGARRQVEDNSKRETIEAKRKAKWEASRRGDMAEYDRLDREIAELLGIHAA